MEKFFAMVAIIELAKKDAFDFQEKGNKAAGSRLRKKMQQVKMLAQDVRKEVSEIKNNGQFKADYSERNRSHY